MSVCTHNSLVQVSAVVSALCQGDDVSQSVSLLLLATFNASMHNRDRAVLSAMLTGLDDDPASRYAHGCNVLGKHQLGAACYLILTSMHSELMGLTPFRASCFCDQLLGQSPWATLT